MGKIDKFKVLASYQSLQNFLNKADEVNINKEPLYKILINFIDIGVFNYTKLNSQNYHYWYYELTEEELKIKKINSKIWTADLNNFTITRIGILMLLLRENNYFKSYSFQELYHFVSALSCGEPITVDKMQSDLQVIISKPKDTLF